MGTQYHIGPLRLDVDAQLLIHDGAAVPLGPRAVAVLTVLVSRANEFVDKSAILEAAWPGVVVEEANLAVQISAIRRALAGVGGGGWIETLARRGYRFIGPVAEVASRSGAPAPAERLRTNLPELVTSFVGRERELAEIRNYMPALRLLTLTGTGGIGKTRLAHQATVATLDAYPDGAWFVDLGPLTDPALVPSALAQVLQVKEPSAQSLLDALCSDLRTRETLLILDNCEHVLDGCARLIAALLRETTHVKVIATSREPLRLPGERVYPVGPLPFPDPKSDAGSIARADAVRLFVERAQQQRPRFDLQEKQARVVAEICVRLDGIPLALELAAARVAVLPVEKIVRLLHQRFRLLTTGSRELPRHQTLRALIDWSYELLDDVEKALFARLSVFTGGWTLEAASEVCSGESIAKEDVVYVLIGLVEQSLVVADDDGDGYRMLETVGEYAREKLAVAGDANAVRERHRDFFLALAVNAETNLTGPEQATWLHLLENEHDNFRSALEYCLVAGSGSHAAALRLCGALHWFWIMRGYRAEGLGWCVRVLGMEGIDTPTPERAIALHAAGILAFHLGGFPAALAYHEESLAIARGLSDHKGIARATIALSNLRLRQGDVTAARTLCEEALALSRSLQDPWLTQQSLNGLGNAAGDMGEHSIAKSFFEESLAIARQRADRVRIAILLNNLGSVTFEQGEPSTARALFEESLAIRRELEDPGGIAYALSGLADVALQQGDYSAAGAFSRDALSIRRALGDKMGIAELLEKQAAVFGAIGDALLAAHIAGAAERLRDEIGLPLTKEQRFHHDRHMAAARAAMGDDAAFNLAWKVGRGMSLEQAIEISLRAAFDRG